MGSALHHETECRLASLRRTIPSGTFDFLLFLFGLKAFPLSWFCMTRDVAPATLLGMLEVSLIGYQLWWSPETHPWLPERRAHRSGKGSGPQQHLPAQEPCQLSEV